MEWTGFGNVNVQKKTLLAGLRELDVMADSRPLSAEEKGKREQLTRELEKVILMAEICWRQKSRALWLKEGDKNSKILPLSYKFTLEYQYHWQATH